MKVCKIQGSVQCDGRLLPSEQFKELDSVKCYQLVWSRENVNGEKSNLRFRLYCRRAQGSVFFSFFKWSYHFVKKKVIWDALPHRRCVNSFEWDNTSMTTSVFLVRCLNAETCTAKWDTEFLFRPKQNNYFLHIIRPSFSCVTYCCHPEHRCAQHMARTDVAWWRNGISLHFCHERQWVWLQILSGLLVAMCHHVTGGDCVVVCFVWIWEQTALTDWFL